MLEVVREQGEGAEIGNAKGMGDGEMKKDIDGIGGFFAAEEAGEGVGGGVPVKVPFEVGHDEGMEGRSGHVGFLNKLFEI
jgi:hypothetical protein